MTASAGDEPGRAIVLMLAAMFTFSVQDATIKWLTADYPVMQIMFFRGVFGLVACFVTVQRVGGPATLRTRRLSLHALRSGLILGALVTFYLAIAVMPLADVVAITFSAPLFMTALSGPLLGEHVGPRRWGAVLVGFVGVLIVLPPGREALFAPAALLAVLSSALFALGLILTRRLSRTETSAAILTYFTLVSITVSTFFLPFQWITPVGTDALLLAAVGLMGGFGAFFMIDAMRLAPVAVVAPFEYSALIWATLIGFAVWGDVPGPAVLAGALVIVGSNLYIARHETRQARAAESL